MNITSANRQSLSDLSLALDNAGVRDDAEIRVKGGGKVLYEKPSAPGMFSTHSARTKRQSEARKLISESLTREFAGKPAGKTLEGIVRKNMSQVLEGTGKVTRQDLDSVTREANRVDKAFTSYKTSKESLGRDAAYIEGRKAQATVLPTVPGFRQDMDAFETIELYVAVLNSSPKPLSDDVKKQLGALGAFAKEKGSAVADLADLLRASDVAESASRHGATGMKTSPQSLHLRQIALERDQGGLCAPLVALVALAESTKSGGADDVERRLEQENQTMRKQGLRDGTQFARDLVDLHGSCGAARDAIKDDSNQKCGSIGHRRAIDHLAAKFEAGPGKPVMYGAEVDRHIMLIGATKHGGTTSYLFYDPNIGTARFQSKEALKAFMDDYFGELNFGADYKMDNVGRDGYEFSTVGDINLDKLAALKVGADSISAMTAPA